MLELVDAPDPEPGPGQLLVRVFATALNRADLLQRRGLYPPPPGEPDILGLEFAGEIARVGDGVEEFARGDRVFGLCGGGAYADFLVVDQRMAVPIPDTLSFDAAAAVPEAFFTAHEALFVLAGLRGGESALVHAGASGVGTAAIQLARRCGARVFTTAGSEAKLARCRDLGAERAIAYRDEDFAAVVTEIADGSGSAPSGVAGVDVILDPVGASYWDRNIRSLRPGGRLVLIGLLGGRQVEVDLARLLMHRISVLSTVLRSRSLEEKIALTDRFRADVLPALEAGELVPVIDSVLPIEDVRDAHEHMEANANIGKIILRL